MDAALTQFLIGVGSIVAAIIGLKYVKTLVFGDGELATCTLVYFELESPDGNGVFVCGADITKLETIKV